MADEDPKPEGDPADFLLSNPKYHDCHLTVGDPNTDAVERIGVSSSQLIAHSPVFRDMLSDSQLADPTGANTHIKDVSPDTFKLMLRHVYGGKLPKMTAEEAAELALCADKYNIQRLVGKATKRLKPKNVDDFLFAFKVVMFIKCPDLELEVTKFVQENTDQILQSPKFLEFDEDYILFIVKQSTLSISELELWKNLVRWAENKVQQNPKNTVRGCLSRILEHVRLLVLSVEEMAKHVLPTKIFGEEEFVDLISAVTNGQKVQVPGLCSSHEERGISAEEMRVQDYYNCCYNAFELETKACSTLTVRSLRGKIEITSLIFKSFKPENQNYSLTNDNVVIKIEMCTSSNGLVTSHRQVTVTGKIVPTEEVTLPVNSAIPLILLPNLKYTFKITASPPLPVHKRGCDAEFTRFYLHCNGVSVDFEDPFHISGFDFKCVVE